ncbi:AfsA-related hotdog domain-containing protein [Streptomyces sp. WZ-12]|uniref:AfsA-related hotdog domain-containing protein n=1 Tax=Streptomyces sp. WZ-12 TaxID=3030210 RepID=UPI0023810D5C|nr:AfsA-related hotdog domain-containing protein [Streptomyces sp. WZ-12]
MPAESARSLLVVGDRFADFAHAVGATTFSAFVHALDSGDFDSPREELTVHTGQGIGAYELGYLREAATRRGLATLIRLADQPAEPVGRQHVHKARADNVLVAGLAQTGEADFEAELRLHDHNELLVDVQDRVHVQGMVAIEASRQMFLAVTEGHILSRWPQQRYYIVINDMNTKFENFLFPVRARLRLHIDSIDLSDPGKVPLRVTVTVEQAGRSAATTAVDMIAFAPGVVDAKELRRAKHAAAAVTEPVGV